MPGFLLLMPSMVLCLVLTACSPSGRDGVVLGKVGEQTLLYKNGLRKGDRLLEVNGEAVSDIKKAMDLVASAKDSEELRIYYRSAQTGEKIEVLLKLKSL